MKESLKPISVDRIKLLPGLFKERAELNRKYVMSLDSEALLQNFYLEANLYTPKGHVHEFWEPQHLGWESPACALRGHFLGHWLSAAAKLYAYNGDMEAKGKADWIVAELARCQEQNGGEWVGSIPEKYLQWIAEGKHVWAPHYTVHKTLMGLYDMYAFGGNEQAVAVMDNWSKWFYRWTEQFTEEQMADILDVETGGMMEVWADLYSITGKPEHLELMKRYTRHRLFDPLIAGEDVLTNMHANTTIPEIHGAARAYEVTGDQRWRDIVEAYWRSAVTDRGFYCTGSQTVGEVWTPPGEFSARLGDKNQEHCVVYNMIRLADFLLRWTGDPTYADYIERNLYNGILAQQNPQTGMITYFLPLHPGAEKKWGTPTKHFWCCHGSLVQAHTIHSVHVFYEDDEGLVLSQYIPTEMTWLHKDGPVHVRQTLNPQANTGIRNPSVDQTRRPENVAIDLELTFDKDVEFTLKIRLPWWLSGKPRISVNGLAINEAEDSNPTSFFSISRIWKNGDHVHIDLPKQLSVSSLPDQPEIVAFMDGPVVLAGLCDEERMLYGDKNHPESLLIPDNEREWGAWKPGYRTYNQERGIRFIPLYEVTDESYTVYFPIKQYAAKV
jgi:DUF1680 family protein